MIVSRKAVHNFFNQIFFLVYHKIIQLSSILLWITFILNFPTIMKEKPGPPLNFAVLTPHNIVVDTKEQRARDPGVDGGFLHDASTTRSRPGYRGRKSPPVKLCRKLPILGYNINKLSSYTCIIAQKCGFLFAYCNYSTL